MSKPTDRDIAIYLTQSISCQMLAFRNKKISPRFIHELEINYQEKKKIQYYNVWL
jgi:hypothetical protein